MTIPGSGNNLVDSDDEWTELRWILSKTLECGCYLNCTCDENDEE